MKFKTIACALFALTSLTAAYSISADDFDDGYAAAENRDYAKAIAKWEPLAKKGHAEAQFYLGTLYHSGIAGKFNEEVALSLYKQAAENGHKTAQAYLAAGYLEGWFGLKKDKKQAEFWIKKVEDGR